MSTFGKWLAGILATVIASLTVFLITQYIQSKTPSDGNDISVQDVRGLTNIDAYHLLQQAGLVVQQEFEASGTIAACRVVRTEPPAGSHLVKGARVVIRVSSGDPSTQQGRAQACLRPS